MSSSSTVPWSFWSLVAVAGALVLPTVVVWVGYVLLADAPGTANPAQQWAAGIGQGLLVALPLCCAWTLEGWRPRRAALNWRGLPLGLAFGAVVALGMVGIYHALLARTELFAATTEQVRRKFSELGIGAPAGFALFAVFITVPHSLIEEYYWRWFVLGRLRRWLAAGPALALSAAGFAAHHVLLLSIYFPERFWLAVLPLSLCVVAGGVFWGWLYLRTGSLPAVWLSHLIVDAAVFVVVYDLFFAT
jgi:membrane protease YdiL (CAAX protease family)